MNIRQEIVRPESGCFIRALYFIFIGWGVSLIWINVAWALNASIIGLPFGLWMINRNIEDWTDDEENGDYFKPF